MPTSLFPQDEGTGVTETDTDWDDAANFAQLAHVPNATDFVVSGFSFTPNFTSNTLSISEGVVRVGADSATTQSHSDVGGPPMRTIRNVTYVAQKSTESDIDLYDDTINHIYIVAAPSNSDDVQFSIRENNVVPVLPSVRIGMVDTASQTSDDSINRVPDGEFGELTANSATVTSTPVSSSDVVRLQDLSQYAAIDHTHTAEDLTFDPVTQSELDAHASDTTNPHSVTAAQTGAIADSNGSVTGSHIANGSVGVGDLSFNPTTQSEFNTHTGLADAHHNRYTDAEAVTAVNAETTLNVDISGDAETVDGYEAAAFAQATHNHDSTYAPLSHTHGEADLTFDVATQAELDTHAGAADAHHTRYTDSEAQTAVQGNVDVSALTSGTAAADLVPKSDGAGGVSWEAESTGGVPDDTDLANYSSESATAGGQAPLSDGASGVDWVNVATQSELNTHMGDTANPHAVTAAQAGAIADGTGTVSSSHIANNTITQSDISFDTATQADLDERVINQESVNISSGAGSEYFKLCTISNGSADESGDIYVQTLGGTPNNPAEARRVNFYSSVGQGNEDTGWSIEGNGTSRLELLLVMEPVTNATNRYHLYAHAPSWVEARAVIRYSSQFGGTDFQSGLSLTDVEAVGTIVHSTADTPIGHYDFGELYDSGNRVATQTATAQLSENETVTGNWTFSSNSGGTYTNVFSITNPDGDAAFKIGNGVSGTEWNVRTSSSGDSLVLTKLGTNGSELSIDNATTDFTNTTMTLGNEQVATHAWATNTFLASTGGTLTGALNLTGNTIDNVGGIEMDGDINGVGYDMRITEVEEITGGKNTASGSLTLTTQGTGAGAITLRGGNAGADHLVVNDGGPIQANTQVAMGSNETTYGSFSIQERNGALEFNYSG